MNIPCEMDLEAAIQKFRATLPGWWYSLGECDMSCDASIAPTHLSDDIGLIPLDDRFNSGFHVDLSQPSTLAGALRYVMEEAVQAKLSIDTDSPSAKPTP